MRKEIVDTILKKLKKNKRIKVKQKKNMQYIGNFKCHSNSLSYAIKHKKKVKCIVGGVQVFTDCVVAHFIVEMKDGTYIDPTYGNVSDMYDSFIIIEKYKPKHFSPLDELMNMKRTIYHLLTREQKEEETINEF